MSCNTERVHREARAYEIGLNKAFLTSQGVITEKRSGTEEQKIIKLV